MPPAMQAALGLAQQALEADPNPRVGCVIVSGSGEMLGQGHTQRRGGPHAEVVALEDARSRNLSVKGATAYVTLEPCAHHGRTGPCCDALIAAGIARVVASLEDPNPLVAGQGFARLRAAGVTVEIGPGAHESRALNIGFFSRMLRGTPWVRLKVAASLDGRTALKDGRSQWITSSAARDDGHLWRARASAVLTGIGTVISDDPELTVRALPTARQPAVAVVDSRNTLPPSARLLAAKRPVWVYTAGNPNDPTTPDPRGVTVIARPGKDGQVDLQAMLADLALREVNELHVEAGQILNGALIKADLVDEYLIYLAPKLIGSGMAIAELGSLAALTDAPTLRFTEQVMVGPDLRLRALASGRDDFA